MRKQAWKVTHPPEVILLNARVLQSACQPVNKHCVPSAQTHDVPRRGPSCVFVPVGPLPALRLTLQGLVLFLHWLKVFQGLLVGSLDLEALCHVHATLLLRTVHFHLQLLTLLLPLSQHLVKEPLLLIQGSSCSIGLGRGGDGLQGSDFLAPLPSFCLSPFLSSPIQWYWWPQISWQLGYNSTFISQEQNRDSEKSYIPLLKLLLLDVWPWAVCLILLVWNYPRY